MPIHTDIKINTTTQTHSNIAPNTCTYTVSQLASQLGCEYEGEGETIIESIAPLKDAKKGDATFLEQVKYRKYLESTTASLVILSPKEFKFCKTNAILTDNPQLTFAKLARIFQRLPKTEQGIHPSAVVGEGCTIHPSVHVAPHVVIGDRVEIGAGSIIGAGVVIGDDCYLGEACRLWANVTLYYGVTLGDRVELHSGVVLGADGFGLAQTPEGWEKIPQLGGVLIGDDVDVGANTTIDRGAIKNTVIEKGVKLDNQIQIGHNVRIGAHTVIAACAGVAGSTHVGSRCIIGGGSAITGHITVTDNVILTGNTGVVQSIEEPGVYGGATFHSKLRTWKKNTLALQRLAETEKRVRQLEKQLKTAGFS